jgi:hypothetical protein
MEHLERTVLLVQQAAMGHQVRTDRQGFLASLGPLDHQDPLGLKEILEHQAKMARTGLLFARLDTISRRDLPLQTGSC